MNSVCQPLLIDRVGEVSRRLRPEFVLGLKSLSKLVLVQCQLQYSRTMVVIYNKLYSIYVQVMLCSVR